MENSNTAGATPKARLEVFVSYAREDASLVRELTEQLKKPFGLSLNFFVDSESIKQGDDWREKINERLKGTDVLLVVSTGQQRRSHDFPGYEVGFFTGANDRRSKASIKPIILPLTIGGKPPTSVADIEGIIIQEEDIRDPLRDAGAETKFLENLPEDNPFRKLLLQFSEMLATISNIHPTYNDLKTLDGNIKECTVQLYKLIFTYLKKRVCSETIPERKIIIRTTSSAITDDEDAILATSTIELVGQSFKRLGVPEFLVPQQLQWSAFVAQISRPEIAAQWREGIRALVSAALSEGHGDNHYFFPTSQGQSFRLFVSLIRTYYSGQNEIHIYIVELAPVEDTKTKKLLDAVTVGCKYRSLFLEEKSKYSPTRASFWLSSEALRSSAKAMWRDLQQVLAEAREDRLADPDLLIDIYGAGGHSDLDDLVIVWSRAESNLNKLVHDVITAADDKVLAMKPAFMAGLKEFCARTEQMNREFTAKALQALETEVKRRFADATPAPTQTAAA